MEKQDKLQKLKIELEMLLPIVSQKFDTKQELRDHVSQYQSVYDKAHDLSNEIEQLERELMTPEEREKEDELLRLMKEKRQGNL